MVTARGQGGLYPIVVYGCTILGFRPHPSIRCVSAQLEYPRQSASYLFGINWINLRLGFRGWAFKVQPIAVPIYRLSPAVSDCQSSSDNPIQLMRFCSVNQYCDRSDLKRPIAKPDGSSTPQVHIRLLHTPSHHYIKAGDPHGLVRQSQTRAIKVTVRYSR